MGFAEAFALLLIISASASIDDRLPAMDAISMDHTELVVLTGDCDSSEKNLTGVALKALGWERGVVIRYNMAPPYSRDSAMTFIKGDHCLAVFSATNDVTDTMQVLGGFNVAMEQPVDMCGFKVNAGVAQEMASFLVSPAYSDFVAFLNDGKCKSVTAAGHSLGGALATLWATCANVKANISQITFGVRSDYALVTFAPFAMATTAVYNGKPGVPFVGMRYSLTEVDGGASARTGLHVETKSFRLQLLELYSQLANMSGMATQATALADVKTQFSNMSADAIEGLWATTAYPRLHPFALWTFVEAGKNTTIAAAIRAQTAKFVASGVLSYEYDLVSSLGGFFGFKHALQDFQPLPNKLVAAKPGSSMTKVPAASASDLPKADLFQSLFSILANGGGFVNHATCCYSSQNNTLCALQYDDNGGRTCNNKLLAFMPATTTTTTATTTPTKANASFLVGTLMSQAHGAYLAAYSWLLLVLMSHV